MREMDGVLNGVIRREAEVSAAVGEMVRGALQEFRDGVPVAGADAIDVLGERLAVEGDARVLVRLRDVPLRLAEDLAIEDRGALGADGDDADVLAHVGRVGVKERDAGCGKREAMVLASTAGIFLSDGRCVPQGARSLE